VIVPCLVLVVHGSCAVVIGRYEDGGRKCIMRRGSSLCRLPHRDFSEKLGSVTVFKGQSVGCSSLTTSSDTVQAQALPHLKLVTVFT
jgi:hypothetical protein